MANRLEIGLEDWRNNRSSTSAPSRLNNKTTNRLGSDLDEWKKKRQIQAELEAQQATPPVAKPVDQVEYEKKGVLRSAMDTFSSQVLGMGELLGTGLKTKSEQIIRSNQQALDEGQAPNAIVRHQYKSNIFLAEKAIKAERAIENFFGEKRELVEEHGEINKEYLNFRKEDGKIDGKSFLEPAKVLHLGAQAAGSLIPALGIGLVTRDPRALQVTMGFVEKGDAVKSYSEKLAEEKGVSIDKLSGKDWDKIDEMSDYYGLVSGALESIVPARFISQVGGKKVLEGMVKKWIYSVPAETLRGAFTEGGTEGLQRLAQNVIAKESGISPNQDLGEGVIEEAAAGALGGGVTGFFGGVAQKTIPFQQPAQPQEDRELPKEPDTIPPPPEAPQGTPVTAPVENGNKITDFLDTINSGDEVAIEETASTLSSEELNQVVSVLDRASEQGTPEQKAVIAEHKSLVQELAENKTNKINGTVGKDLVEDTKDFNNLNETERNEAVKIIDKISETEHETAPKAKAMRETINSNNSIIKEAIERTGEMKTELLKRKKEAETPQEKKEIQTQIDELDEQKFDFKRAENKTDIADVIEAMSPELKKSMKNLTPTVKGRIISNNKQSYERTNNNLGRTDNAGGNAGALQVGESKSTRVGVGSKANVGKEGGVGSDNVSDNGKRVPERQQLKEKPKSKKSQGEQDHQDMLDERDRAYAEYEKKYKTYESPEILDEDIKVSKGDYVIDRDGKLSVVISGNDEYFEGKNAYDENNKGYLRLQLFNSKGDVSYMGYANQIRLATNEELMENGVAVEEVKLKDLKSFGGIPITHVTNTETKKYTKAEIEELAMSKDTFTDAEKDILRQYEGSGGQKDGEGRGVLDEYYTPKMIVDNVWSLVERHIAGEITKIIEPSVGTGRFIEYANAGNSNLNAFGKQVEVVGYETNPVSAKIAKVLNPKATIINKPFEDLFIDEKGNKKKFESNASVVIGNPPYGEHRGKYKGLGEETKIGRYEEYFIKRSLDLTREGGIVAMVVPSGFLRGKESYAKEQIAKLGELVDAYRLPNGSFGTTDVGTDIVIFKKRPVLTGKDSEERLPIVMRQRTISNDMFFRDVMNQEKVLGTATTRKGRFGLENYTEGTLEEAMTKLTNDEVVAEQQAIEEFEDEDKEAVEIEQPFTPEIEKEAVKKTRIAKVKKTRAQVAKKDVLVKGVLKRNEEEPHIVEGIKKGAVKTFSQGEKLSEQDQKFLQLTEEDGSINGMSLSETEKETLNQYEGNFYTDFNYYQGDIYDKLQVLEQEHNAGRIEDKQYERQKAGLEAIKPEAMPINKITLLPIDRLAKDLKLANGKTLVDGFSEWLESLPYDALEGSSRWEIAGYLNGQPVRGGSVEQNVKERTRRRRMGNKLFKKYYNEELEANDQKNIVDSFNRTFNSYVKPDYAKYPLDVELFGKFYGKDFEIRDIQMEGAAFLVNKGVGLLAYEVGVGKTLAGIAAISNVMQKGWAKRPLIIVPKNLKSKWIRDLAESMPNVKINDLSNLGGNFKYKGDPSTLGIGEGTISVITEDGFKRIGFTDETYAKLTDNLEDVLYDNGKKSKRGKEIDKAKTEEIVGKATRKTDFPVTFEQLGFDHITIDEAHRSKNIFSKAKAKGEKGESANEYGAIHGAMSERGLKTYLATQYILSKSGGRNVFLLTATPFNNSPIEIYSMLSLMAKNRLEGLGIKNINDFISMFCEIETRYAIKANGNVQLSDQVRKFSNLQQLQKLVREYIDFRTGEEAGVPRPTKRKITPHLKMNAMQAEYVEKAQELFSPKYKQEGGTLLAISELQKITFSPYLSRYNTKPITSISAKEIVENSPKIKYAVEAIRKAHEVNPNVGQIIFSEKGVELFRPIRDYFVKELKYKASEVEIIDSSCSDAVKDDIQNRFQNGEVKVLLASGTVKEGVDLQKNSTDLYNLYLQWNPTDMIQAEGRTWRQGSYYDNVRIHYPLIQNSIDPFIFQKLEEKASRISNVFSYKGDSLDVSDIDFENMKFELITDPVMRVEAKYQYDKAEIDNKFTVAEAEIAFMERRTGKIAELKSDIESYTERKKEAIAQDDESDVAYYSEKLTKRKAELKEEQDKLDKKGVNVEEVSKEIEAKKAELETIKSTREKLYEQFQADAEVAKEQKYQVISGTNDFNNMLDFMGNKEFFTHKGEEYIGRLPASFKKGAIHDNVADKDAYARLMMVRTPYAEFEKTTKKLLKQHGLKMNVEMFHSIMDTMTNEKVMGITWGDTIGAVEFVTAFTAHHEVLHAVEDALIRSKIISRQMGYEIKQLPEFARFDIDTLNRLTAKRAGGNPKNMEEMREKRAELFEQYVDRKQQLSLPQKLKEYFAYVFKQFLRVHGFLKQVGMMSFFDQLYYGKSKGEQTIIDQNFIKRMTRYEMDEKGKMKKTLNLSELEIAMEFGGNLPSYKAEQEAQEAPQKPLVKDGHISVSELYRRVYNEFYEGKAPAMNSLEDEKLTKGMTKRAFTLGKRYSTKTTKENYRQVQKDVRNYIVKNIPPKHRGELLRAVINAKSKADVDIVIDKVNEMVEKGKGREIASQKKDLMKLVYEIFLARGMTEKSTGRVNGAMLRQAVQHVAKNDGRVKMRQLTIPELEELKTIAQTLKQDKLGRIILINEIKREKLNDLLPEELQGKEFITMGDIESSLVNSDISSGMFGLFNKNLLRAGRLAMIKNEITKKMYDKFTTADRHANDQMEAFDKKIAEMYKKATGKLTSFRDKKTDQKVIDYLEGVTDGATLDENEMTLANEIVQFYADSIEVMKPNRLRKYYFTHTRQNFLESVQSVGFKQTVSEFFNQEFMQDFYSDLPPEIAANLEYIVANRVFNPFGLPRKGKRFSQDLRKALQTYSRVYFTKKNFDKLYAQSNAVLTILPPNMQAFFRRYLQSSKGRPEGRAFNPTIKRVVETATTWEYIKLLGGNLASGFFNIAVGLVDNYAAMGIITKDSLVIGHGRYITPKGYQMINKYRVTGQNITYEMTQLMHTIPEIGNKILFFQLGIGEHYLRGTAFLSLLTHEEFKAGEVSDKRMSEIRHRIGEAQPLYGKFDSPVYGRHVIGKTFYMFLTWLPTRIENWVNWVKGAGSALKNEKGIMDKTIKNKDLGKLIRFVSAFVVMSLLFGDRERWKREVDQYKDLFSIGYWVNLMNPTTKPVWKDVINIGLILKYLANQEEYTKAGTDYEAGDMKWQVYLKRLIEPTAVKRAEQGKNILLEGWLPSEEEETVNKYQYYNSQK